MRWEQAKSMEKEIGRKRNTVGEEKEGEGKGTWKRVRGEEDEKMSRQFGWERGRVKLERRD